MGSTNLESTTRKNASRGIFNTQEELLTREHTKSTQRMKYLKLSIEKDRKRNQANKSTRKDKNTKILVLCPRNWSFRCLFVVFFSPRHAQWFLESFLENFLQLSSNYVVVSGSFDISILYNRNVSHRLPHQFLNYSLWFCLGKDFFLHVAIIFLIIANVQV